MSIFYEIEFAKYILPYRVCRGGTPHLSLRIPQIPKEAAALSKHLHNAAASLNCAPLMRERLHWVEKFMYSNRITPARAGKIMPFP